MSRATQDGAPLSIGLLAERSGVPAKTIRYYEEAGLLPAARRLSNGYRAYSERSVHILRFVGRARELGFRVEDIQNLLGLWNNKRRKSASVRTIAEAHLAAIDDKLQKLQGVRDTIAHLVHCCHGDDRPDCPILDELSAEE